MRRITHTGALPYRIKGAKVEILLITTRQTGRWIIPKGFWPSSRAKGYEWAEKEAYEEAGVEGIIARQAIGLYRQKTQRTSAEKVTAVFPMQVTYRHGIWPEKHQRLSRWVTFEGVALLVDGDLRQLIGTFARMCD
jgi:hypothetical protein